MRVSYAAAAILALGSLAALPACSMMGNHSGGTQTGSAAAMGRPELSANMVRQVQGSLQQQGIYKGNVDGVWGGATQDAVRSYQQSHNLTANGELDAATLKALNLPDNASANANPAMPANGSSPAASNPTVSGPANTAPNTAPNMAPNQAPATTTTQ